MPLMVRVEISHDPCSSLMHFITAVYISPKTHFNIIIPTFLLQDRVLPKVSSSILHTYRLRWSRGSMLAFSTQVRELNPGRSRRIFRAKKMLSMPSFGGEVKPSVPCCRFAACKISLNLSGSRNLGKITGHLSRPQFHLSLLGSLASLRTYRHLAAKV
jgi:hypothetical protein